VEHARDATAVAAAKEESNKDDLRPHESCGRKEEIWFPLTNVPNDSSCCVNNKEGTFVRRSALLVTTPIEALAVVLILIIMVRTRLVSFYL
jgi:hypothetical protein